MDPEELGAEITETMATAYAVLKRSKNLKKKLIELKEKTGVRMQFSIEATVAFSETMMSEAQQEQEEEADQFIPRHRPYCRDFSHRGTVRRISSNR